MNIYFAGCTTVEEVKSLYRTLAKQHHPDRGGDTATMQAINAAYHATLNRMNGQTHEDNGKEYTYRYDREAEQQAMDKIAEILRIRGDFDVYLIGTWVWIVGDRSPSRMLSKPSVASGTASAPAGTGEPQRTGTAAR